MRSSACMAGEQNHLSPLTAMKILACLNTRVTRLSILARLRLRWTMSACTGSLQGAKVSLTRSRRRLGSASSPCQTCQRAAWVTCPTSQTMSRRRSSSPRSRQQWQRSANRSLQPRPSPRNSSHPRSPQRPLSSRPRSQSLSSLSSRSPSHRPRLSPRWSRQRQRR